MNANALHSKYFGESGKVVAKAFAQVIDLAKSGDDLVCVLIDEVETIAGSREHALASHEVGDACRATTQLLTALDKLRAFPNVLVFCTCNFIGAIDNAFVDRADIKQEVQVPSSIAAYEILRSSFNDLIIQKKILVEDHETDREKTPSSNGNQTIVEVNGPGHFPRYWPAYHSSPALDPTTPTAKMLQCSAACSGLSGRVLRRLPCLAIAKYTYFKTVYLHEALDALLMTIKAESKVSA